MRNNLLLLTAGSAAILTGCAELSAATTSCASADTADLTQQIVKDEIIRLASEQDSDFASLSRSKIRASVQSLKLSLIDVRTTKDDPNSTKQFCTATLKVVAPVDMITDADETRRLVGVNSVEELADTSNVEVAANAFTTEIDFNVQPTDDGEKIFAEVENGDAATAFFAELVQSHLLKSAMVDAKAEQERIEAEQKAAAEAALKEQQAASLEQAKAENEAAVAAINAMWKAIPSNVRSDLLPVQRAWQRRKDASCRLEAATNATDEVDIAINRLRCDTREQIARTNDLRRYAEEAIYRDSYGGGVGTNAM